MANITRFDPFKEASRFNALWDPDEFFKGMRLGPWLRDVDMDPQIKVDVSEDDKSYLVKADIPGVSKDDIKVEIDGSQISITAETKREKEEKQGNVVIRSERYMGTQYRRFSLGSEIDASKAEAKYDNGVLQLRLPKKAGGNGKVLKVS